MKMDRVPLRTPKITSCPARDYPRRYCTAAVDVGEDGSRAGMIYRRGAEILSANWRTGGPSQTSNSAQTGK